MYKTLEFEKYRLSWKEFGSGKRLLLAFHGFNRTCDDFKSYGHYLGQDYTILAFDLFFHGESSLLSNKNELPGITYDEWKLLLIKVLSLYGKEEFYVMGYSFGGRVAMNCLELFPDQTKGLVLIASDALRWNPGYAFAAQTMLGRSLFRMMANKPETVFGLMNLMEKVGLFHPKAASFYKNQISHEVVRKKVYDVWTCYRKMVPDLRNVQEIINRNKIPTGLFFGAYDTIIPPSLGKSFAKKISANTVFKVLETGHRVFEKSGLIAPEITMLFK